ncbi:CTTNBP2 N-terminal like b [Megalops cyprinoides]|uniref:CTTNBP2 N-terminal like b n=1 Tax=Megalops cyprinoides TaxID=118141 RepID=UPI001863CCF0|nr:CTTNBP2 N-terminal like b [Megalops cyprinoides]
MGKIREAGTGRMKETRMNMENLSKPELLTLFSILEGELEARDLVIEALRAQHRDAFVQERYGKYDLSDPFLALQRDSEAVRGQAPGERAAPACPNPLAVLKLVMSHCKRMQEKMMAQLAAAESRHRKVIADLEEEKRRHAQDTAEGDDVTYMLEKERERLLQQLDFEKAQVKRLEKEQKKLSGQAEEDRAQHKQLSSALAKECKRASAQAQEEGQRVAELSRRLEEEQGVAQALRAELEAERRRALQMEARAEKQLAEFDTEREQLRAQLKREEGRCRELQEEAETLRRAQGRGGVEEAKTPPRKSTLASTASQTEHWERSPAKASTPPKMNGHHISKESEASTEKTSQESVVENGGLHSPVHPHLGLSPSSPASSSLTSSPCSSPILAKRLAGIASTGYQSSYQAGINQRFQAARHKFQTQAELEQQQQHQGGGSGPHSPRDLSPTTTPPPENSSAKQLARNTVTQVLSRFTSQQGGAKAPAPNSSPFGTDYRNLAASSPTSKASSPLSPGIKSPTIPRVERGHPPPIPPKKPGLSPSPASPGAPCRASHFPELSGSCGLNSTQEGAKEMDLLMPSTS